MSIVLMIFGIIKVGLAGILWRDKQKIGDSVNTLSQTNLSVFQYNSLSIVVLSLGILLMMLSLIGFFSSKRLETN